MTQTSRDGTEPGQPGASSQDADRYREENADLRRLLAERERALDEMLNSSSWRITAPLRSVALWLRKLRLLDNRSLIGGRKVAYGIDPKEYQAWIEISSINPAMRAALISRIDTMSSRPLISIIMPNYNIDLKYLGAAIDSVRRQIYPSWELCISDDASTLAGVRALLENCASADPRIRVAFRRKTGNISVNSNSALDLATGDYVALLDADDLLAEDALYWVARTIAGHPDVDLIFTDEDKTDDSGRRYDPYFKTAWNPALMLSQNAFSHLGVFRRSLVEKVGRFREGFEGAQDLDLVLRCAQASGPDRIRHIPRILYHWRATTGSTAANLASKPLAWRTGRRVIAEHLARSGIAAGIEPARGAFYQVKYQPADPPPLVSVIMPTTLRSPINLACVQSVLKKTGYQPFELLLLAAQDDAASARENPLWAAALADPRVRLIPHTSVPFNYSAVNNSGVAAAKGALVCLLNDDIEPISEDWLAQLVARTGLDGVAGAGAMLFYPSGLIQHAGVLLGIGGVADHAFRNMDRGEAGYFARGALEQDYTGLTAACLLLRRDVFQTVGGFDVDLPVAFNDVDLCLRIRRAGFRLIWTPAAQLCHHESVSFGAPDAPARQHQYQRDRALMRERWQKLLDDDPSYNPNLSLDPGRQFQLAFPPRLSFTDSEPLDGAVSRTSLLE